MKIYRVENKHHRGPFTSNCEYVSSKVYDDIKNYPGMFEDFKTHNYGVYNIPNYHCGFSSIDQLEFWFEDSIYNVLILGKFNIVEIEINDAFVLIGTNQVYFIYNEIIEKRIFL